MLALKLQGPQVKERGDPQKLEKAERQTVPSESPKTRQPSLTLTPALQDPRGISDDCISWERGEDLDSKYLYVCHAEFNAILNTRNGSALKGCTLYVTLVFLL